MAFLSNKTINCLNIHLALVNLLEQAFGVFGPLYLYTHGFSPAEILGFIALAVFLRLPLRFLSLPFIRRFGLKSALIVGAIGYAVSFPVLGEIKGCDGWLLLYLAIYSIFNAMHWWAFHTFYSLAGEPEKRGRHVAVGFALTAGLSALAPVLSAVTIAHTGFEDYFLLAFPLIVLMVINMLRCRTIGTADIGWQEGKRAIRSLGVKIHLADSSATYPMGICWLIAIYAYVGKITELGGIITFGIVVQIFYQLMLGAWVDKGRGTLIANVAGSLRLVTVLGRAFLPLSLSAILGLEALAGAGSVHHNATESPALYNSGKHAPHPLWFWLFAEMAWDSGTALGAGGAALLLWLGMDVRHVILLALPSLLVLWWLLHRYYAKHHCVIPAA